MNDSDPERMFDDEHCPAPPRARERKDTPAQAAKRARLAAPPARRRGAVDETAEAIRVFDAWGMLAREEQEKYRQILEPRIPSRSAEVFRRWREDFGRDV